MPPFIAANASSSETGVGVQVILISPCYENCEYGVERMLRLGSDSLLRLSR
jgi:hypothetical protein